MLYMRTTISIFFILFAFSCQREPLSWIEVNTQIKENFSEVEHITIDEFISRKQDNQILLIDVREAEEYAISHIPGAINITDANEIASLADNLEQEVVVYCSVGYRSAIMAEKLQKIGVYDVANLQGSIFAWANADMRLTNKIGDTKVVHPFDKHWGQLLNDEVPVSTGN